MHDTPTTLVGLLHVALRIPMCHSLKEKRSTLKSCLSRLTKQFNVSAAEVADMDVWGSAVVAVAAVANDRDRVEKVLRQVEGFWDSRPDLEVVDSQIEIL